MPARRGLARATMVTALAAMAAMAALAACGTDGPPDAPAPSSPPAVAPLRVMTWNLQRGLAVAGRIAPADMSAFAARVTANRADVLGLQEVTREQVDALVGALGWSGSNYVETKIPCPTVPPPLPAACVPFGNAVVSRHRLVEPAHWSLPPAVEELSLEDRVLLRSVVDAGGRKVSVYVTHLAANATRRERQAQVAEVLARIDEDGHVTAGPFRPVLLGDLNANPDDAVVAMVKVGFVDVWAQLRGGQAGFTSNPTLSLDRRIDYVFVGRTSGLRPAAVSVDPEVLSDHLPVVAELA